jgi:NAD(P)-dependent dehydrogenase (short-subunit alcohol dehydrogenase family)
MSYNIIVTGGSSGIGKAIVKEFAQQGHQVAFTFKNPLKEESVLKFASQLSNTYGVKIKAIHADVTQEEDRNKILNIAHEFFEDLTDVLINNAGIISLDSFITVKSEDVRKVMETNFFAPFFLTQQLANQWIASQKERIAEGIVLEDYVIVSIGSISGEVPTGISVYEASKAAIAMLNKSLCFELSLYGIRSVNIAPGLVPTELNRSLHDTAIWKQLEEAIPNGRTGTPEEIASATYSVVMNRFFNGCTINIDGGRAGAGSMTGKRLK